MSTSAIIFMAISWGFVFMLAGWAYGRILRHRRHFDPDGIGPARPPEPATTDSPDGGR